MPDHETEQEKKLKHLVHLIAHDDKGELDQVFETGYEEELDPDAVKLGVKKCPRIIKDFTCIAVGYGEGTQASRDALKAIQKDESAKLAKALAAAEAWGRKKVCTPPCVDHGIVLSQIVTTQEWHDDIHSTPVKSYTWREVGYQITKFCS